MKSVLRVLSLLALTPIIFASPIADGGHVAPNSYPHQALLYVSPGRGVGFLCAGSLISPEWVLTSAECARSASVKVLLGAHDQSHLVKEDTRQWIGVKSFFVEHKTDVRDHEIALLQLEKPAVLGKFVQTIRLPKTSDMKKDLTGQAATLVGWGNVLYGSAPKLDQTTLLRSVKTNIVDSKDCQSHFKSGVARDLKDWQICSAAVNTKAGCIGDNGGPLIVTEDDGQDTLFGVNTHVKYPCTEVKDFVFSRVDHWLDWISTQTGISARK